MINNQHNIEYEALLQQALYGSLTADEQTRFDAFLRENSHYAEEYGTMKALETATANHTYPVQSNEYWRDFTNCTEKRLETYQAQKTQKLSPIRLLKKSVQQSIQHGHWMAPVLRAAALLVVGFFVGRWSGAGTSYGVPVQPVSLVQAGYGATDDDLHEFLRESHLLLLGVMNISSECQVASPQTLQSQQQSSIALLCKAQRLRQSFSPEQSQMNHLITEIEYALMQVAAIKLQTLDAGRIQQMQSCSGSALCEISSQLRGQTMQ